MLGKLTSNDDDLALYSPAMTYQPECSEMYVYIHTTHSLPKSPAIVRTPGIPSKLAGSGRGSDSSLLKPACFTLGGEGIFKFYMNKTRLATRENRVGMYEE